MIKILLLSILFALFCQAQSISDIDNKIITKKEQINSVSSQKRGINNNISSLARKINTEENTYKKILAVLEKTSTQLLLNKIKLSTSVSKIKKLKINSEKYRIKKEKIQKGVIDFVIEKYSMSMGIEQADKETLEDVLGKEVYTLILDNVRQEILDLNINYLKINNLIRNNEKNIEQLNKFIKKQKNIKEKYITLELKQEKVLNSLRSKHKSYQNNLRRLINKQNQLTDLLGSLSILKKKEIRKEEARIKKAQRLAKKRELAKKKQELLAKKKKNSKTKSKSIKFKKRKKLENDINIEVKKIGSSAKGIKISKYYGTKTIAPLKSYKVTKKFGKYYDDVYKMKLFNESVSLKTKKPNAKVLSVFKGQIVYAKQNSGLLENVVIVKHKNNLHTIYSHLDKISPTLKVGKWIPKGYVVGRINDTLQFQATKDSKYIDPLKLIK